MSADLAAFLRDRLDEDERIAAAVLGASWIRHEHVAGVHADDATPGRPYGTPVADCRRLPGGYEHGVDIAEHIVRHQPARVVAEIEAKREIVSRYVVALHEREALRARMRGMLGEGGDAFGQLLEHEHVLIRAAEALAPVVRLLSSPYADHPEYREEWRP
ncbi:MULTISPECIES: DUF6221 family protein [Streptomyces]|uniref:DUF6221 family protein n=1 Tax=Streptomyces ehimensis TaxID=68195 RepID=A0ABV9BQK5_9ACTN